VFFYLLEPTVGQRHVLASMSLKQVSRDFTKLNFKNRKGKFRKNGCPIGCQFPDYLSGLKTEAALASETMKVHILMMFNVMLQLSVKSEFKISVKDKGILLGVNKFTVVVDSVNITQGGIEEDCFGVFVLFIRSSRFWWTLFNRKSLF